MKPTIKSGILALNLLTLSACSFRENPPEKAPAIPEISRVLPKITPLLINTQEQAFLEKLDRADLQIHDRGPEVTTLNKLLAQSGFLQAAEISDRFDDTTVKALLAFDRSLGGNDNFIREVSLAQGMSLISTAYAQYSNHPNKDIFIAFRSLSRLAKQANEGALLKLPIRELQSADIESLSTALNILGFSPATNAATNQAELTEQIKRFREVVPAPSWQNTRTTPAVDAFLIHDIMQIHFLGWKDVKI